MNRKNMMIVAAVIAVLVILYMFLSKSENLLSDPANQIFMTYDRPTREALRPRCISSNRPDPQTGQVFDATPWCRNRPQRTCQPHMTGGQCVWAFADNTMSY